MPKRPISSTDARPQTAAEVRLAAIAAIRLREQREREGYASDIWKWFSERLNLLDPLEPPGRQIAPYPAHFPYLKHLVCDEWEKHAQNLTWKSRRMIASNTACGYFAGKAAHLENQRYYLIGRVEGENEGEGARELIARTGWMLRNLRPGPKINFIQHKLSIEFPDTGSLIIGMGGNEPNKMRSIAANGVLCDEFPFWDFPEEAYQALRPTIEGRGKVLLVSTTAEGFFKELVYDETDSWMAGLPAQGSRPVKAQAVAEYLDGFQAWTNLGNGFRIQALDYWADPRKPKGGEWEMAERKGMTDRAFRREYGREFNITRGRPVFLHEWDEKRMVIPDPKIEDVFEPLIVCLDFGYNRPAMTVQRFLEGRRWQILRALLGHQIHFTPFMHQVQGLLRIWYPEHQVWHWGADDAGNQEGRDGPSEIEILRKKFGIKARTTHVKANGVGPSIDTIRDFMCESARGVPNFQVSNHPSCRIVIDGAKGGYRYPEAKPGKPEPTNPHDDGFYIHVWDTIRYGGLNFARVRGRTPVDLAAEAVRHVVPARNYSV